MTIPWLLSALVAQTSALPWPHTATETLAEAFPAPREFRRTTEPKGSFGEWLRALPMKPVGSPVRLFQGSLKTNQQAHARVLDMDVGSKNHQQCADAVIRLRAEYLFSRAAPEEICFRATSGVALPWSQWREGLRPKVAGRTITWAKTATTDASWSSFRRYLDFVFVYAGTFSLERDLQPVAPDEPLRPGDVFVQGGFPGHAVIVADLAENERGDRIFLLAQSYMPAQDVHVLVRPGAKDAWYPFPVGTSLRTPEWTFSPPRRMRFRDSETCEGVARKAR